MMAVKIGKLENVLDLTTVTHRLSGPSLQSKPIVLKC